MAQSPQVSPVNVTGKSLTPRMGFSQALQELVAGKRVARVEWVEYGHKHYLQMKDEKIMIWLSQDRRLHPLTVSLGDIEGLDWIVVD